MQACRVIYIHEHGVAIQGGNKEHKLQKWSKDPLNQQKNGTQQQAAVKQYQGTSSPFRDSVL